MTDYFQNKYRIDSIRLKGWDYRTPGWYFVTICAYDGICHFGKIQNQIMSLSMIGSVLWNEWYKIPKHKPHVKLGEYIVMPNHVHLTIRLNKSYSDKKEDSSLETCRGTSLQQENYDQSKYCMANIAPKSGSLSIVINHFKGAISAWCQKNGHGNFKWQSGFYDHIIRTNQILYRVNEYIRDNPLHWREDEYHPQNQLAKNK